MKTAILLVILEMLVASIAFATSGIAFLKTPPPVELPEAYSVVVKALGTNAAQYHCILASAIDTRIVREDHPNGAWSFTFATTNGVIKCVWFFFDTKKAEVIELPKQA